MAQLWIYLLIIYFITSVIGKPGFGPGEQDWGYVDVREGAHMFYWLYYTTANVAFYTQRPLIIYLQGGPGQSSTGYGNFEEIGPLDPALKLRSHTWVRDVNVLFIDSPVGAGFSYVDNETLLVTKNNEIARDLVAFMRVFLQLHSEFQYVPIHIFSESYGGKMAPEFALELFYAVRRGEVYCNLKSVNIGNPLTSPLESTMSYAPFLLNVGLVDEDGYEQIMRDAYKYKNHVMQERWLEAFQEVSTVFDAISKYAKNVSIYNIEKMRLEGDKHEDPELNIENLMRGPVSRVLNIPANVQWRSQSRSVHSALNRDIMKSAVPIYVEILDRTDLHINIYSGNLDIICATPGTINWINKMQWNDKSAYVKAPRNAIYVNGILEGYEKIGRNFGMFWVVRAGHMVSAENPVAMKYILRKVTQFDVTNNC